MNAIPHYVEPAHSVLSHEVDAEIERLMRAEDYEQDVMQLLIERTQKAASERLRDASQWDYALSDATYAQWDRDEFMRLMLAGDHCAIGAMLHKATVAQFANLCVNATLYQWELGACA